MDSCFVFKLTQPQVKYDTATTIKNKNEGKSHLLKSANLFDNESLSQLPIAWPIQIWQCGM